MLVLYQPMSSPMMTRMLGFLACACAGARTAMDPARAMGRMTSEMDLPDFIVFPQFDVRPQLSIAITRYILLPSERTASRKGISAVRVQGIPGSRGKRLCQRDPPEVRLSVLPY